MSRIIHRKIFRWMLGLVILFAGLTFAEKTTMKATIVDSTLRIVHAVDPRQWKCMSDVIYQEAGNQGPTGMAAVGRVVLNRVRYGFASTPCAVVHQATIVTTPEGESKKLCQFSWTCTGGVSVSTSDPLYQQSKQVAYQVLAYDGYKEVVPPSTLFFHATSVQPNWPYYRVATIGDHVFYSKTKPKQKQNEQQRKRP